MRTLLFDIDGTLLITQGAGSDALAAVMRAEFELDDPDVSLSFSGRTDRSLILELLTKNELPTDEVHFVRLRDAYFGMFPETLRRTGGSILPGVASVLERCRVAEHVRSCVMTGNCQFTAREKLRHFGLLDQFEDVFSGDHDADRDDMARRTRQQIVKRHGQSPASNLVVIGDTPADIRCGKAIGATTIAVCTGNFHDDQLRSHQPDHVFGDLSQPGVVGALLGDGAR